MALAHAILATILDCPCSGYDLRKRFEGSVGFFWQASFQQIYRELGKLEEQGLVESQAIAQKGRPDKKMFAITPEGRVFLQKWMQTPCEVAPLRDELLVKMFAGFAVSRKTLLIELENHRVMHQERLAVYQQIQKNSFPNPEKLSEKELFPYLTLRNGIRFETEWLAWCEEAISAINHSTS
ncbi:PadR family transcriptional regulator [Calothrix sp. 336/3]|uniref:PadR family transcriptional regulator n=1 Tax=Calothrix sp. 336/3 TaxID=1337936 RepID=UPI0004E2A162|nr:PadR family transcriptional regulator [Calothrix sp. 336/3]AKG23200.1 PadR family transcriptional regulator [Calothrix sp. 336/3]